MKDTALDYTKTPRLYCDDALDQGQDITLGKDTSHYLVNVMRKGVGDNVRLFNAAHGEWLCEISEAKKKSAGVKCVEQLRPATQHTRQYSLIFVPVKKTETDLIIQKATELGVTDIFPVISDYAQTRRVRGDRFQSIAREAAEQCERLDMPHIHEISDLENQLKSEIEQGSNLFIAIERLSNHHDVETISGDIAYVVGPEGGFSDREKQMFIDLAGAHKNVRTLTLGETVLRAETAVIAGLSLLNYLSD